MKKYQIKAFTLVELIIVITILAILATIGFMSYQSYTLDARDANRVTTVNEISKGLDITFTKKAAYPLPNGTISTGTVAGTEYAFKGTIGDGISQILRMYKSVDPLSKEEYVYGVNLDKTQYQIAAVLENNTVAQINTIPNTTYADLGVVAKVNGNYPGYVKYSTGGQLYIANIPSLLWNNTGATDLLNATTKFVVNKKTNLPYKLNSTTDLGIKDANTIVKELTGTSGASLTGVNITNIKTSSDVINNFTGVLLASFGGDINKLTSNVIGGSMPSSIVNYYTFIPDSLNTQSYSASEYYGLPRRFFTPNQNGHMNCGVSPSNISFNFPTSKYIKSFSFKATANMYNRHYWKVSLYSSVDNVNWVLLGFSDVNVADEIQKSYIINSSDYSNKYKYIKFVLSNESNSSGPSYCHIMDAGAFIIGD